MDNIHTYQEVTRYTKKNIEDEERIIKNHKVAIHSHRAYKGNKERNKITRIETIKETRKKRKLILNKGNEGEWLRKTFLYK